MKESLEKILIPKFNRLEHYVQAEDYSSARKVLRDIKVDRNKYRDQLSMRDRVMLVYLYTRFKKKIDDHYNPL